MTTALERMNFVRLSSQLCVEAEQMGVTLLPEQATQLLHHLRLVIEKNKVLNLTRIVDAEDAVTKHLVDSLLFYRVIKGLELPQGRFLDLGTGAGFPGIPLGIMTGDRGVLIDSVGKKVVAVQEFIEELGLSKRLSAQSIRAEDYAREWPASCSVVTARAVAELNVLIEYAAPLLCKHGVLVASKAYVKEEELVDAAYAAKMCGMECVSRETFELPHEAGHREVFVYRRVAKPELRLPRKTGMAKHKPLVAPSE